MLPRGMQTSSSAVDDGSEVDYAMAMVVESVEGLTPIYEEACRRPDWPKCYSKGIGQPKEIWHLVFG